MIRWMISAVAAVWMLTQPYPAALAARNLLLGTWSAVYHGRDRYSSLLYYITFDQSGHYKTQVIFGTNTRGKGSGMAVILGRYRMTGAQSYQYWETRYLICPAMQYCNDYPSGDPKFGTRKSSSFDVLGNGQIYANGLTWTRVQ